MKYFEWDENKRQANLKKHGIDFLDAIEIFSDVDRIELETTRNGEKRYQTIGIIDDVTILLVYTYRNKKIRVISARIASKNEREMYYRWK